MMKLVVALALFGACGGPSGSPTGIENATCPTGSALTYENFGETFMQDNCLECHKGKESPSLTTQASILANTADILDLAVYTDAMPEGTGMTIEEREALGEWLACGAP